MTGVLSGAGRGVHWRISDAATRSGVESDRDPRPFHRRLPHYEETPLIDVPALAERLGVRRIVVKLESDRLGLPSFKILGASWATLRLLEERLGASLTECGSIEEMGRALESLKPLTLVAATDGNHGRAVARVARWLGLEASILVPADMADARRRALIDEGATVTVVDGPYDAAVEASKSVGPGELVVSDTSWAGYETVPRWIIDGYATIFAEIDEQLSLMSMAGPDVVAVQVGVGALAAAVIDHYPAPETRIVAVEPERADCVARSITAGRPVSLPGGQDSIMAGLNCGTPSHVAWKELATGLDATVVIDDDWAREGVRALARAGVVVGESGAAGLAGLMALREQAPPEVCAAAGLRSDASVLLLATEGATDPDAWTEIVEPSHL
ncbi:MAG: diaminopropionate ammonia-lyase [Acidimicrobiia bacterium]|nr:diaminopropionate ammonia-lyase [Acidimicrobiia bacterium]